MAIPGPCHSEVLHLFVISDIFLCDHSLFPLLFSNSPVFVRPTPHPPWDPLILKVPLSSFPGHSHGPGSTLSVRFSRGLVASQDLLLCSFPSPYTVVTLWLSDPHRPLSLSLSCLILLGKVSNPAHMSCPKVRVCLLHVSPPSCSFCDGFRLPSF